MARPDSSSFVIISRQKPGPKKFQLKYKVNLKIRLWFIWRADVVKIEDF